MSAFPPPGAAAAIRPARPDDLPALHAIWWAAVEATHFFFTRSDLKLIGTEVRDSYLPGADLLVATDEGDRPLGFLGRSPGELDTLFVHPKAHGRGIGRALIAAAFAPGEPLRVDVNEENRAALGFYRRLGFRMTGRSAADGEARPYPLVHLLRTPMST